MPSRVLQLRAPLLWLLGPFASGLVVAHFVRLPAWAPWPLVGACALFASAAIGAAARYRPVWWAAAISGSAALAGFALLHLSWPHLHEWSRRPPREVTVVLLVDRAYPPAPTARSLSGLATITTSAQNDPSLRGRRVYYSATRRISTPPQRSGRYLVQGVLEPLAAESDGAGFTDYLINAGVRHRLTRARILGEVGSPGRFQRWCAASEDRLESILHLGLDAQPAQRSLYLAMLLGEKAVMSTSQQDAFMQSGTFHIFSISGLHVAVIAGALRVLLALVRMPQRPSVILTIGLLWLYVQITGASSPALRAFLMIAFMLSSGALALPANPLAALAGAALVTLLLDPMQLFSSGFQMSYAVVAALILMGGPLAETWLERWKPFLFRPKPEWRWWHHTIHFCGRKIISTVAPGWAAFLASVPSGIGFFGLLSSGSLVANLVVIPLSSAVIYTGFFSLLTGVCGLTAASALLNRFAALLIHLIERLLQVGVTLPGMFFNGQFRVSWLVSPSLALLLGVMLWGAATGWTRRWGGYWSPVGMLALLLILGVKFS